MKEKMNRFLRTYFGTLGISLLLVLVLTQMAGVPDLFGIRLGNAMALLLAICTFASTMILKSGVSMRELWIRRMAVILINALAAPGCMILCGVAQYGSWMRYLVYAGGCFAAIVLFTVVGYILADRTERRMLDRINEKLQKNEENRP